MLRALTLVIMLVPMPALSQTALDQAAGLYGDATDPETSCEVNPHELSFLARPPHAILTWDRPAADADGQMRRSERYDIAEVTEGAITLLREGPQSLTETGERPIWIMRLTADGYCWGRADWPLVRCERPQVRCNTHVS